MITNYPPRFFCINFDFIKINTIFAQKRDPYGACMIK